MIYDRELNMVSNARKMAHIQTNQQYFLELDIWLPDLQLAFEFQALLIPALNNAALFMFIARIPTIMFLYGIQMPLLQNSKSGMIS